MPCHDQLYNQTVKLLEEGKADILKTVFDGSKEERKPYLCVAEEDEAKVKELLKELPDLLALVRFAPRAIADGKSRSSFRTSCLNIDLLTGETWSSPEIFMLDNEWPK